MATGIIHARKPLLIRLAFFVEGRFADKEDCTQFGSGVFETRPEYVRKYKHCAFSIHPSGAKHALVVNTLAKPHRDAVIAAFAAKVAALTATQEESDIVALPAETVLDATWVTPVVVP